MVQSLVKSAGEATRTGGDTWGSLLAESSSPGGEAERPRAVPARPLHWHPDRRYLSAVRLPFLSEDQPWGGGSPACQTCFIHPCPHLEHHLAVCSPPSGSLSEHPNPPSQLPDPTCRQGLPADHGGQLPGRRGEFPFHISGVWVPSVRLNT